MLRDRHINIYTNAKLAAKVEVEAERRGLSQSRFIEAILQKHFGGDLD